MKRYFQICDFRFVIDAEEGIPYPENFLKFERRLKAGETEFSPERMQIAGEAECQFKKSQISGATEYSSDRIQITGGLEYTSDVMQIVGKAEYSYEIRLVDELPAASNDFELIASRSGFQVYTNGNLEMRYLGVQGSEEHYYACYKELTEHSAVIFYKSNELHMIVYDSVFNSLFALERRMLDHGGLVLHCSYINYKGLGILFSAPSGTGKSTQADLWERFRGSKTINGDRALLIKINDCVHLRGVHSQENRSQWSANGWPVCGTSEICYDETAPIHAIVMLSQSKENHCEMLRPGVAFQQLYSQITINGWNQEAMVKSMDLIEDLVSLVPIYHLSCNISEEAVECLERTIWSE